jgi:hypothetical protein
MSGVALGALCCRQRTGGMESEWSILLRFFLMNAYNVAGISINRE